MKAKGKTKKRCKEYCVLNWTQKELEGQILEAREIRKQLV